LIANNFITTSGSYGMHLSSDTNQDVYYNSINVTSSNSQASALYIYAGSGINVVNNLLINKGTGYSYYVYSPAAVNTSDYNDLFVYGANVGFWNSNQATLDDFKTASGKELYSISANPGFKSNFDLHAVSDLVDSAAAPLALVLYDIDGELRDASYPDIGADEFDSTGVVGIDEKTLSENYIPKKFQLYNNYPNPFNPVTFIKYDLPKAVRVKMQLFNILGQQIRTLVDEEQAAGAHVYQLNAADLASGTYFYRISAGEFNGVRKMLLNK
jgi:hypothetical protein